MFVNKTFNVNPLKNGLEVDGFVITSLDPEIEYDEYNVYCSTIELPLILASLKNTSTEEFVEFCETHEYTVWYLMYTYSCESVGMGGNCGDGCPIFHDGDCESWSEIDNTDLYEDEYIEIIQVYKDKEEALRIYNGTLEQVKGGNMAVPFRINEEFIGRLLLEYYNGDSSLKNPIKMFYESEALSDTIFRMVDSDLNSHAKHKMFALDLYLNGFGDVLNYRKDIPFVLKMVLNNDMRGIKQSLINSMIDNFLEADLTMEQFEYFNINFDILFHLARQIIIKNVYVIFKFQRKTLFDNKKFI